jgi:hypothetical protein
MGDMGDGIFGSSRVDCWLGAGGKDASAENVPLSVLDGPLYPV